MLLLYMVLTLGAVTTVYPFLLMVTTGFKTNTDMNDNKLIPAFWRDPKALQEKYLDDKYGMDKVLIGSTRIGATAPDGQIDAYESFLRTLPLDFWSVGFRNSPTQVASRLNARYQEWLAKRYATIDDLNRAYVEENVSFQNVFPPNEQFERKAWVQPTGRKYQEWLEFKAQLPIEFRIPVREERIFQEWMRGKYQGQFVNVPKEVAGNATKFEELPFPQPGPLWAEFRSKGLPARYVNGAAETLWARHFGQPTVMPIAAQEARHITRNASGIRNEFTTRNYRWALEYILINGRAVLNTAVYCLLAILTALIVNPLAAYALSRYPIRASGKILIFLLATMAFPAEVAMIPSFLLLKDLGLLNTYWALVLPGAASGYTIFLLKGFFDSLPQELFEAGSLDGAKETTMMMKIALPLSRPVLGYIALITFMAAYGAFIYAFLVVQDQRMWTLTVWLYQLQLTAPKSTIMAGLALAALPTLAVFLLAQRVIMRGIVLPGER